MRHTFGIVCLSVILLVPVAVSDVSGHGNPGVDRAPAIDFENKKVTVDARMNPI